MNFNNTNCIHSSLYTGMFIKTFFSLYNVKVLMQEATPPFRTIPFTPIKSQKNSDTSHTHVESVQRCLKKIKTVSKQN